MKKPYCPLSGQFFQQFQPLLIHLASLLKERGDILAAAESCTGGLLSGLLTNVPGSSAWFDRGFVTYSNAAKEEMLEVDPILIQKYGAVSEAVVEAMVKGALAKSNATIAVAITGIAGPEGGSSEKPVGTICFGFATSKMIQSVRYFFPDGNREEIRALACRQALVGLIEICSET